MTHLYQLRTLGHFTIEYQGEVLTKNISSKSQLLLLYLAMEARPHTRDKLASLFWDETTDNQALSNLRTILSGTRKHFSDVITIERDSVSLTNKDDIWVDALAFSDACDGVFSSLQPDLMKLESIAELYGDDFLRHIKIRQASQIEGWVTHYQHELRQKYIRLLAHIVEVCIVQKAYEQGIVHATTLTQLDPYWEVAHRQLMRLYVYSNRPNNALIHYNQLVDNLRDELDTVPKSATVELYETIRSGSLELPYQTEQTSIILPSLPFVEPVHDTQHLQQLIKLPDCRLLTLTGIGGIGKTSLAMRLAVYHQQTFRDGTAFISLASFSSEDEVASEIMRALRIPYQQNQARLDKIIDYLRPREMLLVFDNYDDLLPNTTLIERIIEETDSIYLLITSRTPLNLRSERNCQLSGLQLPDDEATQQTTSEAVRLFQLTAQRVSPDFELETVLDDVVEICRIMNGLPLGIVMAAGWVRYLTPKEILNRVQENILNIESLHTDLPARHQNFENLLRSIRSDLSTQEQEALMSLSIFQDSFTHQAAVAVANIDMPIFIQLVDKSLIQKTNNFRYTLHGVVRQTFIQELMQSDLLQEVQERYAQYYVDWCDDLSRAEPLPENRISAIRPEIHNLIHWGAVRDPRVYIHCITPTLSHYWLSNGYPAKVIETLEAERDQPSTIPAQFTSNMIELAHYYMHAGQYDQSDSLCQSLLDEYLGMTPDSKAHIYRIQYEICATQGSSEQASDFLQAILALEPSDSEAVNARLRHYMTRAHFNFGTILMDAGDYQSAEAHYQDSLAQLVHGDQSDLYASLSNNLGIIALKRDDYKEAGRYFERAYAIAIQQNSDVRKAVFGANLGEALLGLADDSRAYHLFKDALDIAIAINRKTTIINCIEQFTRLALKYEQYEIALQLLAFTQVMRERHHISIPQRDMDEIQAFYDQLKAQLQDDYDYFYRLGSSANLEAIVQTTFTLEQML